MRKLFRFRCFAVTAVVAAMFLIAVMPAALASAETAASSEAPASTGWVPQGTGAEESGDPDKQVRRGTSLGSGGEASDQAAPSGETATGDDGSSEPAEPTPVTSTPDPEESTGAAPRERTHFVPPPVAVAPVESESSVALADAKPLTTAAAASLSDASPAPAPPAFKGGPEPVASSGSDPLPALLAIALFALLVYLGARLGVWGRLRYRFEALRYRANGRRVGAGRPPGPARTGAVILVTEPQKHGPATTHPPARRRPSQRPGRRPGQPARTARQGQQASPAAPTPSR